MIKSNLLITNMLIVCTVYLWKIKTFIKSKLLCWSLFKDSFSNLGATFRDDASLFKLHEREVCINFNWKPF